MGYLSFTDAASMFGIGMGEFLTHIGSREGYADKEFLAVTLNYFRREFPEYEARDIEERTFQWKGSKYEREVKPRRIEEAERELWNGSVGVWSSSKPPVYSVVDHGSFIAHRRPLRELIIY